MCCDLTIQGILDCGNGSGSGSSGTLESSVAIGNFLTAVNPGYALDVNGERALDVNGDYVYVFNPTFVRGVDGQYALDVNGRRVPDIGSNNWSLGRLTPLSSTAVAAQWVTLQAMPYNYRNVWVGGPGIVYGGSQGGNWLSPTYGNTVHLLIDDLSKVFIIGYGSDEVTGTYGMSESQYLGGTGGFGIAGVDYTPLGGAG